MEYLIQLPAYEISILGFFIFVCVAIFTVKRALIVISSLRTKQPFFTLYDVFMVVMLVGILFTIVIVDRGMWSPPKHDITTATRLDTNTVISVYEGWECVLYRVDDQGKDIFRHCLPVSMKPHTTIQNRIKLYRVYNYNPSIIRWVPWIN